MSQNLSRGPIRPALQSGKKSLGSEKVGDSLFAGPFDEIERKP